MLAQYTTTPPSLLNISFLEERCYAFFASRIYIIRSCLPSQSARTQTSWHPRIRVIGTKNKVNHKSALLYPLNKNCVIHGWSNIVLTVNIEVWRRAWPGSTVHAAAQARCNWFYLEICLCDLPNGRFGNLRSIRVRSIRHIPIVVQVHKHAPVSLKRHITKFNAYLVTLKPCQNFTWLPD